MIWIAGVLLVIGLTVFFYMQLPSFGASAKGERLRRIKNSPHFKDGIFHNLEVTPQFTNGHTLTSVMRDYFFKKYPRRKPVDLIPSEKTNLHELDRSVDGIVWFGHSSYFMQLDGVRYIIDPVFSGNASPLPRTNTSFPGSDQYTPADIPEIDIALITHDHYDHIDYPTIKALRPKIKRVVCGLGVGAHLERWGYDPEIITEMDWGEQINIEGIGISYESSRHFSGRGFASKKTLWGSFVLTTPAWKIYVGGDSGYGTHFAGIGQKHGPFDFALLDNGQYNVAWQHIHMLPEEVWKAADDLKAKNVIPIHSSKFAMANHAWDEPLQRVMASYPGNGIGVLLPIIGQWIDLRQPDAYKKHWWENVT